MDLTKPQRNRRSRGWVELDKETSPQAWKARWPDWSETRIDNKGRVRPKQRSIVPGYKTKDDLPTKKSAEERWDAIRESSMNPVPAQVKRRWTFSEFVTERYVPERSVLRSWRRATSEKFDFLMSKVMPAFGSKQLDQITTAEMQKLLVQVAQRECEDTVKGLRTNLRAIFKEAVEEKIIEYNPARKLSTPKTKEPDRPVLTAE